jgi:hypothetical protein
MIHILKCICQSTDPIEYDPWRIRKELPFGTWDGWDKRFPSPLTVDVLYAYLTRATFYIIIRSHPRILYSYCYLVAVLDYLNVWVKYPVRISDWQPQFEIRYELMSIVYTVKCHCDVQAIRYILFYWQRARTAIVSR